MSKSNTTENDLMQFIFNAVSPSWNAATDFYVALHTADPGEAGDQTTSEVAYTSYARVIVSRSAGGWDVVNNQALNDDLLQFPQCTGGSAIATHVSVGLLASGAGQILYSGALASSLSISNGIQPQFSPNTLIVTED